MRRGRTKVSREVTSFKQAPYGQKKNPFQPMSIFSEDEIESIHEASLKVLCDTGIDIQSPRAVEILKKPELQLIVTASALGLSLAL